MYCKHCNEEIEPIFIEMKEGPHYGKHICSYCDKFLGWVKKPKNEGKREQLKYIPEDFDKYFCEICGRKKYELGEHEKIAIHHKIPIKEGGKDIPENILVLCTFCHRLCHFLKKYLLHHLDNFYSFYKDNHE